MVRNLLVVIAGLASVIVAQIAGVLAAVQGGTLPAAFATGGVAFGATATLLILVINTVRSR